MKFQNLAWSFTLFYTFLTCNHQASAAGGVGYVLSPHYDFQTYKVLEYKIVNTLKCNVSQPLTSDLFIQWSKDDVTIEKDDPKYEIKKDQLRIHRTTEEDIITYTCTLFNRTSMGQNLAIIRADIHTMGKPTAKISQKIPQGAFIEGQKITLECISQGNPKPHMEWRFGNQTFVQGPDQDERVKVTKTSDHSLMLQIDEAAMTDRGLYICRVWNDASQELNITIEAKLFVRVKDKLAALWPFIGICAEVIVLCAIILVYERNRLKSELEESDTDISPEQKNTPDHGKDSVRQRK